jgi:iron complex transport system substrate-binding protein
MKKIILVLLSLILTMTVSLLGCNSASGDKTLDETETDLPMTVTDDLGRVVTIEETPAKIVSLAPSNTEILFALGLGDKVFGVTEYCDYPEEVLTKEKVGGYSDVDIEKIVAIDPDLILAEDMHKTEVIPMLEDLGFTVIAIVPNNLQEVMDSIMLIGQLTGTEAAASQIVDDMSQRIKVVTDVTDGLTEEDRLKVLYVIWYEPISSVGSDTRIHELIEMAGGINIAEVAGEGYPTLTLEEIVSISPQVIIVNDDVSLQAILNESRLSEVDAVVNGRVYSINADLTNRPTARIVEGLELMAKMVHPEIFGIVE